MFKEKFFYCKKCKNLVKPYKKCPKCKTNLTEYEYAKPGEIIEKCWLGSYDMGFHAYWVNVIKNDIGKKVKENSRFLKPTEKN